MTYKLLTDACGGALNPTTLAGFDKRIDGGEFDLDLNRDEIVRQYRHFMYRARIMFAPKGWSRQAQLEHLLIYIREMIGDMAGTLDEEGDERIKADIYEMIGELGL